MELAIILVLYFIPSFVASKRKHLERDLPAQSPASLDRPGLGARRSAPVTLLRCAAVLLLVGCTTHGLIRAVAISPGQAATLTVIRPFAVWGSTVNLAITIDHEDAFGLGSGEHATLEIPAGERLVGAECHTATGKYLRLQAEPGQHYFVHVKTRSFMCSELVKVDSEEGARLMGGTERLLLRR